MIWVCRTGMNSVYLETYLKDQRIYLPWNGYRLDLNQFTTRDQFKELVREEKGNVARTSISNWAGQLYSFCKEMKIGDYVLIPHKGSRSYTFAIITGDYVFCETDERGLWHSRKVELCVSDIPREAFSQSMKYTLGAFRTVFKVRDEEELLTSINNYCEQMKV